MRQSLSADMAETHAKPECLLNAGCSPQNIYFLSTLSNQIARIEPRKFKHPGENRQGGDEY